MTDDHFDPSLDLTIERLVPVRAAPLWRCWTEPDLLKEWFCPKPWRTSEAELDVRPGGRFATTMVGPNGESHAVEGCFLVVEPERRLVFTDTMTAGFRPAAQPFFTGIITMTAEGEGTRYVAIARHGTAETRQSHADMGFEEGWNAALDQLVELASRIS